MSADARKLFLVRALLALRARRAAAFDGGSYTPLDAGPDAVAFLRGEDVAVAVPLREGGLDPDLLALPDGDWRPAFDPELLPGASVHVLERGRRTCCESADCVSQSSSAARVNVPWRATATK